MYGEATYTLLSDETSDKFDDYEIEDATDRELEELFLRLQLGTSLNTAEKLNAIGRGLRDFCHNVSSKPFFAKKISLRNARYAHLEIIAR